MHVLGMPPAFVLSQDQTLNLASVPPARAKPSLAPTTALLSGIDKSYSLPDAQTLSTVHGTAVRASLPLLPNNVKEHSPQSEGAGLISLRPDPVNKLFCCRSHFLRSFMRPTKTHAARCSVRRWIDYEEAARSGWGQHIRKRRRLSRGMSRRCRLSAPRTIPRLR